MPNFYLGDVVSESPELGNIVKGGTEHSAPPLLFSLYRLPTNQYSALFEPKVGSVACRGLVMRYRPNGLGITRVGVISMKKTYHHAVERSRARRLMREAFRLERPRLAIGYDLVLLGRRALLEGGCAEARRDLIYLSRKAGLLVKAGE